MKAKLLLEILKLFVQVSTKVEGFDERISAIEDRLDEIGDEFMALKDQITELVNKVSELQATLADEVTELKTAIDALFLRIKDLEGIDIQPQINAINDALAGIEALSDLTIEPDTAVPTQPGQPSAGAVTSTSVELSWSPSTDNVGVTSYTVFANGSEIGTASTNAFSATGLTAETQYLFAVVAKDAAGNTSVMSDALDITTPAV